MNGNGRYFLLGGAVAVALGGYVQGAPSIRLWADLFGVQNTFGLIGVVGGVLIAYFTKSYKETPSA